MFAGYPYSREQLEKLNEEIQKNNAKRRAEHPFLSIVCGTIYCLSICGFWLFGFIIAFWLLF